MGQQRHSSRSKNWRSEVGPNSWLARLVDAMEKVSRPDVRAVPCNRLVLAAVHAQLARPASAYAAYGSHFSLRN